MDPLNIFFPILYYAICMVVFMSLNCGISRQSRGQQLRRYAIGTLLACSPLFVGGITICYGGFVLPLVVSVLWVVSYNALFHLTNKGKMPDYDNHMDIAFAQYTLGWLLSLHVILPLVLPNWIAGIIVTTIEILLLLPIIFEWGHYFIYGIVPDTNSIAAIRETDYNEAIEFIRSFKPIYVVAIAVAMCLAVFLLFMLAADIPQVDLSVSQAVVIVCINIFLSIYMWKKHHGLFVRTGIATLWQDVSDYNNQTRQYKEGLDRRLSSLEVTAVNKSSRPRTVVFVIGESGCRDYMSLYKAQPWNTTPWQQKMENTQDGAFLKFDHAYSCAMQTVPSLERVLTESNLQNNKSFFESCSIIDIAHKLGYEVHWYSNQGHLGVNDTAISIVAETADIAQWTEQEVGKVLYDEALLDFTAKIDPEKNNLVVFHLIGSHFNYNNRYPKAYAEKHGLRIGDDVQNYRNSLHYNDDVLRRIYETVSARCNMDAMLYMSDHGAMPDTRRSPRFLGYGMVRIPMWLWCSDSFVNEHKEVYTNVRANKEKFFTNDLTYELLCSILDVRSNHFCMQDSLASACYSHTPQDLLTDEGRVRIKDDPQLYD